VFPEAGSLRDGTVSMWGKVLDELINELIACKTSSLGKAVHAFADFEQDAAIDDEVGEFVLLNDEGGKKGDRRPHVFLVFHGGVEIEIFDIGAHPACIGRGDSAIDEQFDSGDLGARGGGDALAVDEVTTDSPAHATWISFLAAASKDGAETSCCTSWWQLGWMDELAGVGAGDFRATDTTIGEATDFIDVGLNTLRGFWAKDELAVLKGFTSVGVNDGVDKLVAVAILGVHKDGVVAGLLALGGLVSSFQAGGVSVTTWWSAVIGRRFGLASRFGPALWLAVIGVGQSSAGAGLDW
jgi:hypothetical protein